MSRLRVVSVISQRSRHNIASRSVLSSSSQSEHRRYAQTQRRGIVVPPPRAPIPDQPFEEETLPHYSHEQFYPVHIGDCLDSRYDVIGKLGYGAHSTVWFCRDLSTTEFVSVKVCTKSLPNAVHREEAVWEHLADFETSNPGALSIREPQDCFYLHQKSGHQHVCFVYKPMHMTLLDLQRLGGKTLPLPGDLVKQVLHFLLGALDFLHSEANIVHCDIQLANLMLPAEDNRIFSAFLEDEVASPAPKKTIDTDRAVYASRRFSHPSGLAFGPPVLCDFGEARIGSIFPYTNIQPNVYKAPEVLLELDWDKSVDIWNVGCVAWDMLQAQRLFDGHDEEGHHNNRVHLGEMTGFLGPPPLDFQSRSVHSWRVFDEQGKWKAQPPLSPDTLEDRATKVPDQSKPQFMAFLRSMLQWRPEDRKTAKELLDDPWLKSP